MSFFRPPKPRNPTPLLPLPESPEIASDSNNQLGNDRSAADESPGSEESRPRAKVVVASQLHQRSTPEVGSELKGQESLGQDGLGQEGKRGVDEKNAIEGGVSDGRGNEEVCESTCPACGHHVAVSFFDGGAQPLTTLAWPESTEQAQAMPRLPHRFVRCVDCGHIYNADFNYADVPYSDKPNLMYNRGTIWSEHLESVKQMLAERLHPESTVVEIGCGDGSLLSSLAEDFPLGRFVGFDPNSQIDQSGRIEARAELFIPSKHLAEYRPDLIISRHVLEHLLNPLGFIQQLAFAVSWNDVPTSLFIEVPCVDNVLDVGRTVDFFYEHNSHFTTISLRRMLNRCASNVGLLDTSYNDEVVFALARFTPQPEQVQNARESIMFRDRAEQSKQQLYSGSASCSLDRRWQPAD